MNPQDETAFQNAVQFAHAGQVRIAYDQFCKLTRSRDNRNNPDVLLWIAQTTPSFEEAQRAINEARSIEPHHPGLLQAQAQLALWVQPPPMQLFPQVEYNEPINL